MVEYLRPSAKKHSIIKVRASVYLPQEIIRPDEIFQEIKGDDLFKSYQKKTLKKSRTIEFPNVDFTRSVEQDNIDGFIFEEYDVNGKLTHYLSLVNEQKKAVLTLESRIYTKWDDFITRFRTDVFNLSKFLKIYLEAISLTYVDDFLWMHPSVVPVNKIFNIKSDLLNNKFLKSENGSIILISQDTEQKSEERIEIAFSNRLKRVSINHQYVIRLNIQSIISARDLIDSKEFDNKFNIAHDSNKSMLDNLLSIEVKDKIGLK